jgi:hypothetical protein
MFPRVKATLANNAILAGTVACLLFLDALLVYRHFQDERRITTLTSILEVRERRELKEGEWSQVLTALRLSQLAFTKDVALFSFLGDDTCITSRFGVVNRLNALSTEHSRHLSVFHYGVGRDKPRLDGAQFTVQEIKDQNVAERLQELGTGWPVFLLIESRGGIVSLHNAQNHSVSDMNRFFDAVESLFESLDR